MILNSKNIYILWNARIWRFPEHSGPQRLDIAQNSGQAKSKISDLSKFWELKFENRVWSGWKRSEMKFLDQVDTEIQSPNSKINWTQKYPFRIPLTIFSLDFPWSMYFAWLLFWAIPSRWGSECSGNRQIRAFQRM